MIVGCFADYIKYCNFAADFLKIVNETRQKTESVSRK